MNLIINAKKKLCIHLRTAEINNKETNNKPIE
jgi:hypothetical protein